MEIMQKLVCEKLKGVNDSRMSYAFTMYETVNQSGILSEMCCILEYQGEKIPFPLKKNYLVFGTELEEGDFLLGDDGEPQIREVMTVEILTPEYYNGEYCRECAKDVCMTIVGLDAEKRINSLSSGKCEYDKDLSGYRIRLKFGLREVKRNEVSSYLP